MEVHMVGREMLAAGTGCATANAMLNGLETTKVKLQLQNALAPTYRPPTMAGVVAQVARQEGIARGLMTPGIAASLVRSMTYGAYRVGLYSTVRSWVSGDREPGLSDRMIAGMFTGGLGSALSCPLDVVRTRMQADSGSHTAGTYTTGLRQGERVRYTSMLQTFTKIAREEGVASGLYRGASVTIARASLLGGSQLASYDSLKRWLGWEEGAALHATCSLASGVIAQTVIMPIDTVKSHLMLGKDWRTVFDSMRAQGPRWFFRGYVPACAGQGMIMVLQMPLVEELRRVLGVDAI